MRVFVASLATETNTFSPLFVDRSAFESAFYCPPGTHPETPTLCSAPMVAARRRARTDGFTLIEGTATWAEPAGLVSREAYESLRDEILDQLKAALPVDVVLFGLHGSMVARGYDDCEGDLLAHARAHCGRRRHDRRRARYALSPDRPDGAGGGRHRGVQRISAYGFSGASRRSRRPLPSCREGRGEAGKRGFRLPLDLGLHDQPRAWTQLRRPHEGDGGPGRHPQHFDRARLPGCGRLRRGHESARRLPMATIRKRKCWPSGSVAKSLAGGRAAARPRHYKPEEAIAEALTVAGETRCPCRSLGQPRRRCRGRFHRHGRGPAAASRHVPAAIGALWDPVAVTFCRAAGAGATDLPCGFGGKAAATSGPPVDAQVRVRANDGRSPRSRSSRAGFRSAPQQRSRSAISTWCCRPPVPKHSALMSSRILGIDLATKKIVVVKSSNHFHAAFAPVAKSIFYLDTGGPYPSDTTKIPYTKARRPLAPLDPNPWL